ncbi:tape measure protein [Corynebacterium sp.]|uniref:tape measure protein n=1 Tax=Corynebacterium sp. TaxID=1720 RepID=UPI0028AF55A1|nr:tape measure protein [Corynebacterium sp.]
MSSDLGHLFATLDIKDEQFKQKIAAAKTDLVDLKRAADDAAKVKLDVKPTGGGELDSAKKKTDELNQSQKKADSQKVDVKPTGTGELDKATDSAEGLGKKLDEAGSKAPDVAPTGADQLDDASSSASDLGQNLDDVHGPDVAPTGKGELDDASSAAHDLDNATSDVDGPDVTPTGTGDVTTAAREAGELDTKLQKAGQSGKSLTVSAQPAQELDKASNSAGKLVDKLGEVAVKASKKAIKWGAVTAGAAAIGGIGTALTKGFQRLDSIDQANAKLQGLGHSAQDIEAIMASAMDAVKGTAYGFGDAASLAAQMVASGIEPGEELTGVLTTVADTAAIAGRDLNDMGLIFGSVAAKGKLQGDDLMQLMAGGIPVLQMLSDELGKTTEEVSKMASDGEIDFKTFESAMKNSLGGAAQDAGNTFKGSMDNAGAAVGRLGAELLKPAFDAAPGVIGNITSKIDELTESAGPVGEKLAAGLSDFAQGAIPQVQGALSLLKSTAETVWPVLQKIGDVATNIPMEAYVGLIGMAVAKHKGLTGVLAKGGGAMKGFGKEVSATQSQLILQGRNIGVVSTAMMTLGQRVPAIGRMGEAYRKAGDGMRVAGMMSRDAGREMGGIVGVGKRVQGSMQSLGGTLSGTVASGFSLAKTGASGLLAALGGPWGLAIGAATTAIFGLISKHQEAAAAEAEHQAAQQALKDSLDDTTGSITDQTRELQIKALEESGAAATARELGLSTQTLASATTGNAAAQREVRAAVEANNVAAVKGSDYWKKYGKDLEGAGFTAEDLADRLNGSQDAAMAHGDAMDKIGLSGTEAAHSYRDLANEMDETITSGQELTGQIGELSENLADASEEKLSQTLNDLRKSADQTKDAFKALGDAQFEIKDSQTISVATDDMTEATRKKLEDIGAEVSEPFNGRVDVTFPEGINILDTLDQIGIKAKIEDGYIEIAKEDLEASQEGLDLLNLKTRTLEDGRIVIDSDDEEVRARMLELGMLVEDEMTGQVRLADNIDDTAGKLDAFDGTTVQAGVEVDAENIEGAKRGLDELGFKAGTIPQGELHVIENSDEVKGKLDGLRDKTVTLPDGRILVTDNTPETMSKLDAVGARTSNLPNGAVFVDSSDADRARGVLDALGITTVNLPNGDIMITDNSTITHDQIMALLGDLHINGEHVTDHDAVEKRAEIVGELEPKTKNKHDITTNAAEARQEVKNTLEKDTHSTHYVDIVERGGNRVSGRAGGGRIPRNARGSRLPRYASGDRHSGYRLPTSGPGTGVTDGILGMNPQGIPVSWVDAGEWIINGDSSEEWDGTLAAINGGRPSQIVAAMLADLEAHANGGKVSDRVKSGTAYMDGTPYIFGGWSPAGVDCSGAVSLGVNRALGRDDFESRCGTANMGAWLAERGFQQGQGGPGDIRVGWYNGGPGGGHTAMQLGDGTFIESGGNTGGGYTIGKSAGPLVGRGFTDWMYLPSDGGEPDGGDIGDAGSGSYSAYNSTAGSTTSGGGSSVSKSVNGGAGPLLKDGSVLEAAAAAYSLQTGQPMPDDVVSWGSVLGLGTTFEAENLETEKNRHEREMRAHDRNIKATQRDLEQAKKDVVEKEKALAEANPEDKEQAQWELDDARDKVADLSDKLLDMRDETVELRKTNEQLKVAVERQKAAPTSAGQAFGITAMADGGILGAARNAQINEGSATLWAEAGPEAYIPLSRDKKARSLDIWAETGKRLGVDVMSLLNLVGSGLPGLMEGKLQFSSGDTTSLDRLGLNMDAAKHAGGREIGSAVGAVFNGPVTLNDPRSYLQGQLNTASRQINKAMKSRMLP